MAESALQEALDSAWSAQWTNASGEVAFDVPIPFGSVAVRGVASIDKPTLHLIGALNRVRVGIAGTFRVTASVGWGPLAKIFATARTTIDLPILASQSHPFDNITVDLSRFTLTPIQVHVTPYDGALSEPVASALDSDEFRSRIEQELRRRLTPFLTFRVPTSAQWAWRSAAATAGPGGVRLPVVMSGGVQVLDGWVAIGINDIDVTDGTHGDLAVVGPPPGGRPGNVVIVMDGGRFKIWLERNAQRAIQMAQAYRPQIHPLGDPTVVVRESEIEVQSIGGYDAPDPFPGRLPYGAKVIIRLGVNGGGGVYGTVAPHVEVDAPWYIDVLGDIIDFFGGDVFAGLRRVNTASSATLFESRFGTDIPGLPTVSASIVATGIVISPDVAAIYGEVRTSTSSKPAPTRVWFGIDPGSIGIRQRYLTLKPVAEPYPGGASVLQVDPTYLLHFELRRGTDSQLVVKAAVPSGPGASAMPSVDLWAPANYLETFFDAQLSVERAPGVVIGSSQQRIQVNDLLDRRHRYARWWRYRQYAVGIGAMRRVERKARMSAIHKTDIRERCRFCDFGVGKPNYEALDAIPEEDLNNPGVSFVLCSYCFRGG
jgi:hypothetical protein